VGAALNVIPYFFYDLTETKQKAIIRILKIRAMIEDYGNGVLTDDDMKSTMEVIRSSKEMLNESDTDLKALKKSGAAKSEIKAAKKHNEEKEISTAVIEELERFTTKEAKLRLDRAKAVVAGGIEGIASITAESVEKAKALPAGTAEEREIRKNAVADAKLGLRSQKAMAKYYPGGIKEFDEAEFDALCIKENELAEKKAALLKEKASKSEIAKIAAEQTEIAKRINEMNEEHQHFVQSTSVYHKAKKYIEQAENYAKFGELDSIYSESLQN
ncbi:MAG: hypothetical protein IK085_02000, partial [Clostridia bacterium]|nr:hypothetical protein [Clostridia bacterium]